MANILRHGRTPKWGTATIAGMILDSFNTSVEIKDYEQTDENGAVCGYLVYDQTESFDFSGTLLNDEEINETFDVGAAVTSLITNIGTSVANSAINTPNTAILKSLSVSTSAGSATTISGSGTIYDFTVNNG